MREIGQLPSSSQELPAPSLPAVLPGPGLNDCRSQEHYMQALRAERIVQQHVL